MPQMHPFTKDPSGRNPDAEFCFNVGGVEGFVEGVGSTRRVIPYPFLTGLG